MRTTCGHENILGADARHASQLKTLLHRWHETLADICDSRLCRDLRDRIDARRRGHRACDYAPSGQLPQVAGDIRDPEPLGEASPAGDGDARDRQLVPLPSDRSQALAVVCDRLLQELDAAEVTGAEIRFVVRKDEHPNYPHLEAGWVAEAAEGELVFELRRLIAWSGGAIADVAHALEERGAELDEGALGLLKDEFAALDVDLATLGAHLADAVDWDRELGCLLAGEVAPFDDLAADENDEHDD